VLFALLTGAAVARSRKVEWFFVPALVSIWLMGLLAVLYFVLSGYHITMLAGSGAREFLSPLGLHANDLGRLYAIAYALLLFACAETSDSLLRSVLVASMGLVAVALVLTFSRGALFGFVVVNALFLLSRRSAATWIAGCAVAAAGLWLLPDAVYERLSLGFDADLNTVSAGRLDTIWLPLLPEFARSPLFGHGLSSIMWSDAMRMGVILPVDHPHNAYLRALLDMGVVGACLVLAYFVHVWRGFQRLGSDPSLSPLQRGFYAGAAAGLVSFLVAGVAGSSLTPVPEQSFLWLAVGMMYGEHAKRKMK
jgi:O-antigen ligase